MKRGYITPTIHIQAIEPCTLMAGSGGTDKMGIGLKDFGSDQLYHGGKLTPGGDATDDVAPAAKDHGLWDDGWNDDID